MRQILAASKQGKNVLTSSDPNDFIFHSDYNTFKIIVQATKSITLAASTSNQSFTQAHGLSFIPLVTGFARVSGEDNVFMPNQEGIFAWNSVSGVIGNFVKFNYIKVDATNITFNFDNANGSTKSVSIRYFCLEAI